MFTESSISLHILKIGWSKARRSNYIELAIDIPFPNVHKAGNSHGCTSFRYHERILTDERRFSV